MRLIYRLSSTAFMSVNQTCVISEFKVTKESRYSLNQHTVIIRLTHIFTNIDLRYLPLESARLLPPIPTYYDTSKTKAKYNHNMFVFLL